MTQNNAVDPIADIGHQTESAAARRERLIRFISSQPLPIMPLSVSIGEDGEIRRKDGTDPLRFTFRWREIAYTGTLRAAPEGVFLSLIADLGVLPYSAEAPERRQRFLSLVGRKSWFAAGSRLAARKVTIPKLCKRIITFIHKF